MPITEEQKRIAEEQQNLAATDTSYQNRLLAGPGTGKSSVIEKRVLWLLRQGVSPRNIYVISFTRASSTDLKKRIIKYCVDRGREEAEQISISTLHSLALSALRQAHLITYPGTPSIIDDWELENIFDKEFSDNSGYQSSNRTDGYTPSRCKEIRKAYEAFWGTGEWNPVNFTPPDPPISEQERDDYQTFHNNRTQVYSCILPGEVVQKCITQMNAGVLNPVRILGIRYLIVDEYQDLNPIDIRFIDLLTTNGVNTFVAGDDDQSIYSFRFASPLGIQKYNERFPEASLHVLRDCFRCTPVILRTAQTLIDNFHDQNRVQKQVVSLYEGSNPPVNGINHFWRFRDGNQEASVIAKSIGKLIDSGINPNEILILLSNPFIQLLPIIEALGNEGILYESPREKSFFDTNSGRFIIGLIRVVCNNEDYFAYRLILGCRPNIGSKTCNKISEIVTDSNLNYKDIFTRPLPDGVFNTRLRNILNSVRNIISIISTWQGDDLIQDRIVQINQILGEYFGINEFQKLEEIINILPGETKLYEFLEYIITENSTQKENILQSINNRLNIGNNIEQPENDNRKVQIMTMHGAKGLNSKIVFIPGLEDEILPGERRNRYVGLVLEAARMLYVSITRAMVFCILSYSENRNYYGRRNQQTASRFLQSLNGYFNYRNSELSNVEIDEIIHLINNL